MHIKRMRYIFLVLILLAGSFPLYQLISSSTEESNADDEVEKWMRSIQNVGAEKAYRQFLETYNDSEASLGHEKAHLFGEALFEALGKEGVVVCDRSFASGCFHELLGRYFLLHGLSDVEGIRKSCNGRVGCNHGVGHGIQAFLGYEKENLQAAITACEQYGDSYYRGCLGGMFMEYNTRTLLENTHIRQLDTNNIFEPCEQLDGPARNACFTWQTQLWEQVLFAEKRGAEKIEGIVSTCLKIESATDRKYCLYGVGNNAWPQIDWNVDAMIAECDKTSDYTDFKSCIEGGIMTFIGDTKNVTGATQLCASLEDVNEQTCLKTAIEFYNRIK